MNARLLLIALVAFFVAGCATTEERDQAAMARWVGKPVRVYAEARSLAPVSSHDRPDGTRAFLFRVPSAYGGCGVTMISVHYLNEWLISEIQTTCGAPAF